MRASAAWKGGGAGPEPRAARVPKRVKQDMARKTPKALRRRRVRKTPHHVDGAVAMGRRHCMGGALGLAVQVDP